MRSALRSISAAARRENVSSRRRICLARSRSGDDKKRIRDVGTNRGHAMLYGVALFWIESGEIILAGHDALGFWITQNQWP
jgi:hypothetical protein